AEALERLRAGAAAGAVEPLARAVKAEPDCPTPALLLAAVHLEGAGGAEEAYPLALAAIGLAPEAFHARAVLLRAAGALGYRKMRERMETEAIERAFEGPERQYRLYRLLRDRDPERARAAFEEYRRLDPGWDRVRSAEGEAMREALEALEKGEGGRAAALLAG